MYGILISFGILISVLFAEKFIIPKAVKSKHVKKDIEIMWGGVSYILIFGVIGARLYYVLSNFGYYAIFPVEILMIWRGGLGIYGAIIGAFVGLYFYSVKTAQNLWKWLDVASLVMPLGHSIGRWGNYFNQELFGKPTELPWGISIDVSKRPSQFVEFEKFHPLFLYESILNILLFLGLFFTFKKNPKKLGSKLFLFIYLFGYGFIRFFIEFLKIDFWLVYGINLTQVISLIIGVAGFVFLVKIVVPNEK